MATQAAGGQGVPGGERQIPEKGVMREKMDVAMPKVQFTGQDILVVLCGEDLIPDKVVMRERMDVTKFLPCSFCCDPFNKATKVNKPF
jgi:hypothetical protein